MCECVLSHMWMCVWCDHRRCLQKCLCVRMLACVCKCVVSHIRKNHFTCMDDRAVYAQRIHIHLRIQHFIFTERRARANHAAALRHFVCNAQVAGLCVRNMRTYTRINERALRAWHTHKQGTGLFCMQHMYAIDRALSLQHIHVPSEEQQ